MLQETSLYPLSPAQQQLWLTEQMMPGTSMNNIMAAKRLLGPMHVETLKRSLEEIIRRHETLRTTFTTSNGQPMQVVAPTLEVVLPIFDLWKLTGVGPQEEVRRLAGEQLREPFDLEKGPLVRTALLRLGDKTHILLVTMHHLISDGWSLDVFSREIEVLYKAYAAGKPSPLPELLIRYSDFASMQRQRVQEEVYKRQLDYWKEQLANAPAALELPSDRMRPAVRTFKGARLSRLLPRSLTAELKALSQSEGVTLFMTLLAAFQSLLHRYSRQEDILVGSPIANRNRTEIEGMMGLFVNTLVLRTDLSGNPSFRELLKRVRKVAMGAYAHQETPFEKLVEELVPERHMSHTPLFQVMFVFQNARMQVREPVGVTTSRSDSPLLQVDTGIAKFDLTLSMTETPRGIEASFKYSTDLFEAPTVSRMLGHLETLLLGIVANPEQRLSELPLLTPAERHQLLVEWNQTDREFGSARPVHLWFEAQAEITPAAVAVVFENHQLTYRELNHRANQLAHHLQRLGVGPERMAGLCMERSIEMIVGLLGILKAGGAYVPLDPTYPRDRLAFILEDTQAPVVLTQERLLGVLPATSAVTVCMDADWETICAGTSEDPATVQPGNLAYVLYTSGSTGQPKGVTVEHQQLWSYTQAILERLEWVAGFSSAMVQPLAVDSCLTSIFPPLCTGGAIHLISQERAADAYALADYFQSHSIDCLKIAPSHLAALHTSGLAQQIMPRRLLVIGGEASRWDWVSRLPELRPEATVFNHYGPTEATVGVLTYRVQRCQDGQRYSTTPLGRPLANTQIYLLDELGQPVPIGVPGEIYIGGANVARGYLNRPELTAESFIPDTFRAASGGRLYKTGDRARYLADGNLEFLSRTDDQVKIRGFRIELKEIEAVLRQHPDVRETVVLSRRDVAATDHLVAYIVSGQVGASNKELRGFLGEHLPDYMVPASFVRLEALPRTPHGKIDRQALPAPAAEPLEQVESYAAPRNRTEQILAGLWAQVLRLENVGIHDNFFEMGGDSILGIQIIARANQAGVRFTSRQLFQYQTIAQLAPVVGAAQSVKAEQGVVTGVVPLTPIQHRFFEQHHTEPHHFNQAFLLEVQQDFASAHWATIVRHLIEHHDALRLRFALSGSGWVQHNATPDEFLPFSQIDLSDLSEREQKKALRAAASQLQASLNLTNGPIMRVAFFDLGAGRSSRLLIIVHHLAIDGVSWRVLLEDLQTACGQLSRGETIDLPPKSTSFKYWAEKLNEHAHSPELRQELTHWLTESQKLVCPLPVDHPEGRAWNTEASARSVSVSLSSEETQVLLREVPKLYRTQINDILLTALAQAFSQWTGSRVLLVSFQGHGRKEIFDDVDLSRTVGCFTSSFPVQLNLDENLSPGEALKSIKEQLRRVPRHGIGYGIFRYLATDDLKEQLQGNPLPEVSFNYLGQFDQVLSVTSMLGPSREAKSVKSNKSSPESDLRGPNRSGQALRHHLLEITGSVLGGQLGLTCTYSEKVHRRSTIKHLADGLQKSLQSLLTHCQTAQVGVHTPSDHPLAKLDQQQLDQLMEADSQIEQVYPLSPLQHSMLFHSVYAPESRAYVGQYQRAFDSLSVRAFKRAWRRVVQRHSALRTGFVWKGMAESLQFVRRTVTLVWDQQDWRGLSEAEREARLEAYRRAVRQRGFDLSAPPLMRMGLMRVGEDKYQFVWSHHHILSDGWSTQLILREVNRFHTEFSCGRDLRLKSPRPYQDYIAWLQHLNSSAAEAFWRKYLQGFTAPTQLPMDRIPAGSRAQDESDRELRLTLSNTLTAELETNARKHHLTLNTLLQAVWALLLGGYTGENDVVFGTVVSGRPPALAGVESMVGLFINTLPVRVRIPPESGLLPWLQDLQTQQAEAREYQYSSPVQIQGWSEVPRGLPLFESILVFENYPTAVKAKGSRNREVQINVYNRINYLTIIVLPGSDLVLKVLYDSHRFEDSTITRMLGHLRNLLEGMVSDLYAPIRSLTLTSADERRQLLVDWNNTHEHFDLNGDLVRLFERQVEMRPEAIAFLCDGKGISYWELNRRANQLAHRLKELGVGPELVVGICLERSLELAIALVGVLKAQAAFLPLDPSYPSDRLAFMLDDAAASVVVTDRHFSEMLSTEGIEVVFLDQDAGELSGMLQTNPDGRISPEQLAYVIYTSGSTGRPKGVAVNHEQILNRFAWMWEAYPFAVNEVCCQKTAFNFVDSIWEFLGPLLKGVPSVIIPDAVLRDPARLVQSMAQNHVTRIWVVPSFLRMILDNFPNLQEQLPDLRFWVASGEPLPLELFQRFSRSMPRGVLYNLYGTSEVWDATWYEPQGEDADLRSIPIGRPISNVKAYVLDPYLQIVPVGARGELYIGGVGLARGYVKRPELTAEKFLSDPYSDQPGARMYRTGDLARYMPDGNIEFLGRVDHQVKIRGFRIELSEIETVLAQHCTVRQAVVVAREESVHEKRLVAYVVPEQGVAPNWGELREFLGKQLPTYMMPSAFVKLEALPLTPNGKLDRRALPEPASTREELQSLFVAPRNSTEEALAGLWIEMFGLDRIGIYDSFFDLGGHSLRAMQMVSRIRDTFQVEVSLRIFFESPTVAGLSGAIAEVKELGGELSCAAIAPTSRQEPYGIKAA